MNTMQLTIQKKYQEWKGFRSEARQDEFVYLISKKIKNGFYLDIGSCDAEISNNTFFLAELGWNGICIEIDSNFSDSYYLRPGTIFINSNALTIDYLTLLNRSASNGGIDYLSVDIDKSSTEFLEIFPFKEFLPKIITIEHDKYLYGERLQSRQFQILNSYGYQRIFKDIFVQQPGYTNTKYPFEDWYIHKLLISENEKFPLATDLYPSKAINLIKGIDQ